MSHIPTEEEMFELMYDDELDIEMEMERENRAAEAQQQEDILSQVTVTDTPKQLPSGSSDHRPTDRQLNRRLFDNSSYAASGSSTPFVANSPKPLTPLTPFEPLRHLTSTQNQPSSQGPFGARKRCIEELFGDIHDIDDEDVRGAIKRQKTEEEIDLEMIERILELRKKRTVEERPTNCDDNDRKEALHKFKQHNLSTSIPKYPFIPVTSDGDRIYIRFHSEDFEDERIREIQCGKSVGSLMSTAAREAMWARANEMMAHRLITLTKPDVMTDNLVVNSSEEIPAVVTTDDSVDPNLWVEKYRPKRYLDLLSDESTNRNLLKWIKMWDKIVFQRDIDVKSLKKETVKFQQFKNFRRKERNTLNSDYDAHGRPIQKIALLCGAPGLGKTTLAHAIARHAGYNIVELNASDDRSPEAFKLALENGTQMKSFLGKDNRPNCIILDEIDGAPKQSIDFLIKFIGDNVSNKGKNKAKHFLRRPIICICNDMYVPALRQLRQEAFVVDINQMESGRLADRLQTICRREKVIADYSALLSLAEKSGNDIRSCLSMLEFFSRLGKPLTLIEVLQNDFGQKDMQKGLVPVLETVFQITNPRRTIKEDDKSSEKIISSADSSMKTRVDCVLDAIHMFGDYNLLVNGVYENYLTKKMPDPNMIGTAEATEWFCFTDRINQFINHRQNYSVYSYMQYGFVAWHLLFASLMWPKIFFPKQGFEFTKKANVNKAVVSSFKKGSCVTTRGVDDDRSAILDTIPLLRKIISPVIRTVSVELMCPKERSDLVHTVEVMVDHGLEYHHIKKQDGTFQWKLEPDIGTLCDFDCGFQPSKNYLTVQMISREVQIEKMRRAAPKFDGKVATKERRAGKENVPNHLRTLNLNSMANEERVTKLISKDIFGRVSTKSVPISVQDGGTDAIIKSSIWYKYKEGFNNAVRKDVTINNLL
ncbi:Chromosome transmission fidelity protein 18 like [Pseudolycoriella hygida]|uniref:Chromosome transmission fidelity protein 18 like n=1 Tax=Pseudolycoriella hygida TaxID=35572 RepID=A0A9Q0S7R0_9DIPT|nr:Chromosome transmission fidelity protein 18 like [Pseudolycoriella hygida]